MTLSEFEAERKLEDMRRQLELMRTQATHSERERWEFDHLRHKYAALEAEAEDRARRAEEAEVMRLRQAQIELQRIKAAEQAHKLEAHELEDMENREARRKLAHMQLNEKLEREAHQRAKDAKTQAELKAAKDELDRSEF